MPPKTKPTSSHSSSSSSKPRPSRPSSSHSSSSSRSSSKPSSSHSSSYKKSSSPSYKPSSSHSSSHSSWFHSSSYEDREEREERQRRKEEKRREKEKRKAEERERERQEEERERQRERERNINRNNAANALYGRVAAENTRQQISVPSSYVYHCPYCGGDTTIPAESTDIRCPNCNAVLTINERVLTNSQNTNEHLSGWQIFIMVLKEIPKWKLVIFIIFFMGLISSAFDNSDKSNVSNIDYEEYVDIDESNFEENDESDKIYVSALKRDVPWSDEYGTYYDKQTDCYFFKNYDVEPPIWQYWFEGISSDYGDYGWLEYDYAEKCWYVQVSDDEWEVLSGYDTSSMWHFEENE